MDDSSFERVVIESVSFNNLGFVVLLRREDSRAVLPIFIGASEAHSIAHAFNNQSFPRPLTHDLFTSTLRLLDCSVPYVAVTDLIENTFYAKIFILREDAEKYQIDARPSDAIAIALRFTAPIYVSKAVMENAAIILSPDNEGEEEENTENTEPASSLRRELDIAISEERYEDAARLRDELKKILNKN
ncbi:MAG: bifunctional nuclease family protein [Spirochaetota bacterium]|jgi:bifunctional DNase/RNase|nr:bifunctional nuclease family protein [Spirochaetota bacterium]